MMNFDNEIGNQLHNYLLYAGSNIKTNCMAMPKVGGVQIKFGGS